MKSLLAKLLGISRDLLEWLWPILRDQTGYLLETLLPIALQIVSRLATDDGLTGPQKKDKAVNELKQVAIIHGVTAGTNVLNLAVEMAVAKLRSK
jgi:hypothetical protein